MKQHLAHLQHAWMSAISKAEAYNEAFLKEENVAIFQKFLRLNPKVGHHFNRQVEEECEVSGEDNEEQLQVNTEDVCLMFEMRRKSLSWALLKNEMMEELKDRNITQETFGPKTVQNARKSFKETADEFMTEIDRLRQKELYPHKKCYPACKARGCKWVIAVDGLWKLRHAICA